MADREPKPLEARSTVRRLLSSYRGPIMRVRFPDGHEADVYDDDPTIEVPAGALRMAELEAASGGGDVHVVRMPYDQSGNGRDLIAEPGHEPTVR